MDYYKKYIKYKNKYNILREHLGGGTNNFFKILQDNNITNGQELSNNFNFYTISAHGASNNLWFTVPPKTYILFTTNATLAFVSFFEGGREMPSEFSDFVYQKPENKTELDWYNSIYSEIERKTFFEKLLYKDSNFKEKSYDESNPITSIYEPGDIIQDLDLVVKDESMFLRLFGIWKNPVPMLIKQNIYDIATPHIECINTLIRDLRTLYSDLDFYIYKYYKYINIDRQKKHPQADDTTTEKILEKILNDLKEQFKDVSNIYNNAISLKDIDTLFNRIYSDMEYATKKFKGTTTFNLDKFKEIIKEMLPKLRENIECINTRRLTIHNIEERLVMSNEKQIMGKVLQDGTIPIPRVESRISYSGGIRALFGAVKLSTTVKQLETYESKTDNKPFKFIVVSACRIENNPKSKQLQRSMSVGVRERQTFNIPYLKSLGIDVDKLLESEKAGYDIFYLEKIIKETAFKSGDIVYIINIHPTLNGRTCMFKEFINLNGENGYMVSFKYNKPSGIIDIELFIKMNHISKNYDPIHQETDEIEFTRINSIIESKCYELGM